MSNLPFFPPNAAMPMKPENIAALVAKWHVAAVEQGCQEIVLPGWLDAASPLAAAMAECGFVAAETLHFYGGWANLWLKHGLREPMEQMGVQAVRYWVNAQRNSDTMKAARLSGARELACRVRLVLPLRPGN